MRSIKADHFFSSACIFLLVLQDDADLRPEDVVKVDGFGITEGAQAAGSQEEEEEEDEADGAASDAEEQADGEEEEGSANGASDVDEQADADQLIEDEEVGWDDI